MVYAVLLSALLGSLLTVLLQCLLLYRRKPEPLPGAAPPNVRARPIQPDTSLREYLQSGADKGPGEPQLEPNAARQAETPSRPETCQFLNAIFLFLFRELRDTALVRRWVTKKIKVEFEELLLTRTAGRLLEGLSLRDISLGDVLPVFKSVRLLSTQPGTSELGLPEEISFEVELEYNGGFHLAIDVDLVFGKSAYLFVKLSRVLGRLRLVFTRLPFTHWSFCFLEDPLIDFEVQSQFEGRPMSQLTSIIVNQLKKVIKRKHTLPNYKIRYKPFFPFQVLPPVMDLEDRELSLQDMGLTEGRLKVTLIDCSRLLIFGSYDQETPIHCTLELGSSLWKEKTRTSIKTAELIKGSSQSLGLIMVQARDGDTGHVCIEYVTPNSPAAAAELKKGDRLIAIGGIKVTSSVQASKLIKQAGDRVLVFYERPVGQNQYSGILQENFAVLEDPAFTQTFEEDTISIIGDTDIKEQDSEFEDLAFELKTSGDIRDDTSLPITQSPKRIVPNLSSKPLGSISPILNRKLNLPSYQTTAKTQTKVSKTVAMENQDSLQPNRPSAGSSNKPPVPPRPQIKLTLPTSETQSVLETGDVMLDKPEKPFSSSANSDKQTEKPGKHAEPVEDLTNPQKPNYLKQDTGKDKISESSISTKDSVDDQHIWESPEILYKGRQGRWTRSSCTFEVESYHRYLNVALWCRDSFKTGSLSCVGHVSIKLEEIALECLATSSLEYFTSFRLNAPEPKAVVSRTALRSLSMHKGFNEKFCYGDITLNFKFLLEGESENSTMLLEREREVGLLEDVAALQREEVQVPPIVFSESKHNFQDTQFQNSTLCDHCKRKVWTKAASQCMICGYVCHKKCQEKCLTENPYCVTIEKRVDLESKSLGNRTAVITRHIINTSSRLLNLRQAPKARQPEQGSDLVEPSPKHTPNTSDNESSDTETCGASSPSKRASGGTGKLVRKEGGLDDSVFIAVKEIGRDLYRGLPTDERIQKLEFMLDKLQNEIDQELEHNNSLVKEEKETTEARKKTLLSAALVKSGERLQALTLLMIHYRAGIEDIESLEISSLAHPRKIAKYDEESIATSEVDNNEEEDAQQVEPEAFNYISEDKLPDSPEVV